MWAERKSQGVSEVGASLGVPAEVVHGLGDAVLLVEREGSKPADFRLLSRW